MQKIAVMGIGTEVGKTVVSAILTELFEADYFKPIQTGFEMERDTDIVSKLITNPHSRFLQEIYAFKKPASPHDAAAEENATIDPEKITLPLTTRPLVIEGCGGIYVPLNDETLFIELLKKWDIPCVLVASLYLGSINHTLLSIDALKKWQIPLLGIVFNGPSNPASETIILKHSHLECVGRITPKKNITKSTIQRYVKQWKPLWTNEIVGSFGTLSRKQ